ncbi:MAG: sigma-70 family RNA polymerase sigma factor [Verrucomicrobiales bacterium]|nr:sigma-70 family RNA polymerase sigma factor [Verrucomicrobiales bacterium]
MLSEEDQQTFTRLWTEAQPSVSHYLMSLVRDSATAKDLLQNTALVLLRKFSEYDRDKPFLPWALGVAKFELLGHRRDQARSRVMFDSEMLDRYTEKWSELAPVESDDSAALQTCLAKLPERLRKVVRLRYFDDLNSGEIAKALGMNAGSVRVSLQRTRDQLRKCVERELGMEGGTV